MKDGGRTSAALRCRGGHRTGAGIKGSGEQSSAADGTATRLPGGGDAGGELLFCSFLHCGIGRGDGEGAPLVGGECQGGEHSSTESRQRKGHDASSRSAGASACRGETRVESSNTRSTVWPDQTTTSAPGGQAQGSRRT